MTDETATPAPANLFEMVPTSEAYMQLTEQVTLLQTHVEELQAGQPAITDDDAPESDESSQIAAGMESLSSRIDRHRAEIENIKTVINHLIKFLGSPQSTIPAAQQSATGDTMSATGGL